MLVFVIVTQSSGVSIEVAGVACEKTCPTLNPFTLCALYKHDEKLTFLRVFLVLSIIKKQCRFSWTSTKTIHSSCSRKSPSCYTFNQVFSGDVLSSLRIIQQRVVRYMEVYITIHSIRETQQTFLRVAQIMYVRRKNDYQMQYEFIGTSVGQVAFKKPALKPIITLSPLPNSVDMTKKYMKLYELKTITFKHILNSTY